MKIKHMLGELYQKMPMTIKYPIDFTLSKGRPPRLLFPKDYCDFIFRDNFWGRHNLHAFLADKLEVRKYVERCGLSSILVPLIGYWDDAKKIDFDSLPNQFALKCNHSCGMNIVCYDKEKLDIQSTIDQLNIWLKQRHPVYWEQHYNHIKPMILCEAIIPSDSDGFFPMDYKIHCANGKPVYIQCCLERTNASYGKRLIFDLDWNVLPYIKTNDNHSTEHVIPKPLHLKEMIEYAALLSAGLKYARVDLYDTDQGVLFGEITLTPMGGMLSYFTQEALDVMGTAIRNK